MDHSFLKPAMILLKRSVLFIFVAYLAGCDGRNVPYTGSLSFPSSPHPNDPSDIVSLAFSLSKPPQITETRGHAHSPLGVSGEDSYRFDGTVRCENQDMHLLTAYHPIAVYRIADDVFLLGRYVHNERYHQWHQLIGTSFAELPFKSLPRSLWLAHPENVKTTAIYRLWVLNQLIDAGRFDDAIATHAETTQENPHFIFECNRPSESSNVHCVDFVSRIAGLGKGHLFYDSLAASLNVAKPTDNCQDVGFLAYSLTTFRPDQGNRLVSEFIQRVHHEAVRDDQRLRDLTWRLEAAKSTPRP